MPVGRGSMPERKGRPEGPRRYRLKHHLLRHTFCSHLAMRGAAAKAIQDLAGHQSMHLAPGALRTAIDLLEPLQAGCKDTRKTA